VTATSTRSACVNIVPDMSKIPGCDWLKEGASLSKDGKSKDWIEVVSLHCIMLCQLVSDLLYTDYSLTWVLIRRPISNRLRVENT
jgi:hypothetical protein